MGLPPVKKKRASSDLDGFSRQKHERNDARDVDVPL